MKSISDTQQALIDRFLAGELTDREQARFEQQLQDPHFREALEWHRQLVTELEADYRKEDLKTAFRDAAAAYHAGTAGEGEGTATERPLPPWRVAYRRSATYWRAAAAGLALLLAGAFIWANLNYSHTAIAQALEDPLLENVDQSQIDEDVQFQLARDKFFDGRYEEAERLLRTISPGNDHYLEAQTLLAYSAYHLQRYDESIRLFTVLLEERFEQLPSRYRNRDKLRWARLLNYVGLGETDTPAFRSELSYFLDSPGDYYREKAERLQRKLESPWRFLSVK